MKDFLLDILEQLFFLGQYLFGGFFQPIQAVRHGNKHLFHRQRVLFSFTAYVSYLCTSLWPWSSSSGAFFYSGIRQGCWLVMAISFYYLQIKSGPFPIFRIVICLGQ